MKRDSFVMGVAALCAFAAVTFAQVNSSPAASSLQSLGAADPDTTTHFSVYLPVTHQAALEQLVSDQTAFLLAQLSQVAHARAVQSAVRPERL